jgi:hypothetical protein
MLSRSAAEPKSRPPPPASADEGSAKEAADEEQQLDGVASSHDAVIEADDVEGGPKISAAAAAMSRSAAVR